MEGVAYLCPAKNIPTNERHQIAPQTIHHDQKITELAAEKQVSRDFVYAQKDKEV